MFAIVACQLIPRVETEAQWLSRQSSDDTHVTSDCCQNVQLEFVLSRFEFILAISAHSPFGNLRTGVLRKSQQVCESITSAYLQGRSRPLSLSIAKLSCEPLPVATILTYLLSHSGNMMEDDTLMMQGRSDHGVP